LDPKVFKKPTRPWSYRVAIDCLGVDLARHWLSSRLFSEAKRDGLFANPASRSLPADPGTVVVWCAVEEQPEHLLPAVPIVCRWEEGTDHSPRLPEDLRRLATDVVDRLRGRGGDSRRFGLQLEPRDADLSGISRKEFTAESGALSLMVGLLSAMVGVQVDATVGFSAAWDFARVGWRPVERLREKAKAAAELGIQRLLVSPGSDTSAFPPNGLRIEVIDGGNTPGKPLESIQQAAERIACKLLIPPQQVGDDNTLTIASRYYQLVSPLDRNHAEEYYLRAIVRFVGEEQRKVLRSLHGDALPHKALVVTSYTGGFGQLGISPVAFDAWQVLVLVPTGNDIRKCLDLADQLWRSSGAQVEFLEWPVDAENFLEEEAMSWLMEMIRRFAYDSPVVIDFTPGQKFHSILLFEVAKRLGAWACYLNQRRGGGSTNLIDPSKLQLLAWNLGSGRVENARSAEGECPK
jgi:hypothetical protein